MNENKLINDKMIVEDDFSYRKLYSYQYAKEYVKMIYLLLKNFPVDERYALCDQLRRSSVSIVSNIAEGSGRLSVKEKMHFIEIAFGSLTESMCQMELAYDLGYISYDNLKSLDEKALKIRKTLSGLHSSYKKSLDANPQVNQVDA